MEELPDMIIDRKIFREIVSMPSVQKALDDLEVRVDDPMHLFDTLDADNSGTLDVHEMLNGIMRLRGNPERSEIVACLLGIRDLQTKFADFEIWTRNALGYRYPTQGLTLIGSTQRYCNFSSAASEIVPREPPDVKGPSPGLAKRQIGFTGAVASEVFAPSIIASEAPSAQALQQELEDLRMMLDLPAEQQRKAVSAVALPRTPLALGNRAHRAAEPWQQ